MDKHLNQFATAGVTWQMFNDVSPGNHDGPALGFIGGGKIHSSQRPIGTALQSRMPEWGEGWKEGMQDWYGHSIKISISTSCMLCRNHYVDLDPCIAISYRFI